MFCKPTANARVGAWQLIFIAALDVPADSINNPDLFRKAETRTMKRENRDKQVQSLRHIKPPATRSVGSLKRVYRRSRSRLGVYLTLFDVKLHIMAMTPFNPATIKLFLPFGDPKRIRTAEISNWNGKAVAAPRTEIDLLLAREELGKSGVYILTGTDPQTDRPMAYIGEGEVVKDRLKKHKGRDFWVRAFVFISQDENLTKAHVRYLEGRIIENAKTIGRFELVNTQPSGSRLPESDRADMDVFLGKIYQLLPVLGSDIVTPILTPSDEKLQEEDLICEIKGLIARGRRTTNGFVVLKGSQAVLEDRPSAAKQAPYVVVLRQKLTSDGTLVSENNLLRFKKDAEFSSPSAAAAVIYGGSAPGPIAWKNREGKTLKQLENE